MLPVVQETFRVFNTKFEGCIPFMYLDIKGLVTVAVGNLVDPVELAKALPFRFKDKPGIDAPGTQAMPDQIAAEWQRLKSNPSLAREGHTACEPITDLELGDDAIDSLIADRITRSQTFLKRQQWFADFDSWPADAQLGLLSMAWAMGPAGPGNFPKFRAACQNFDFNAAAAECKMDETGNPGLIPRNQANFALFSNAAFVLSEKDDSNLQRSNLYYPRILTRTATA
jgi:hypothetical protein